LLCAASERAYNRAGARLTRPYGYAFRRPEDLPWHEGSTAVIRSAGVGQHWDNARLRRLLLVSIAALIPVLAGCEAGDNAPTTDFHYPTDAAGTVAGELSIRNVFVLGAPLGSSLAPGQSASLFFAIVNTGTPDRLLSITAPGVANSVRLPAGGVLISTNQLVLLTGPQPQAYLVKLLHPLASGTDITLNMYFQKQGVVTIQVPVFARATHYVTYSPAPSATAVTTTAKHKHHAAATPSPSPSAG
jgi:copper(I)-binding protein